MIPVDILVYIMLLGTCVTANDEPFGRKQGIVAQLADVKPSRIALVIPSRGRHVQAHTFYNFMKQYAYKHNVIFDFYFVEQSPNGEFNRGMMVNAGVRQALRKLVPPKCIVVHDVDRLPVGTVAYDKCQKPTHLEVSANLYSKWINRSVAERDRSLV